MGKIQHYHGVDYVTLADDGIFPNNEKLPLLLYRRPFQEKRMGPEFFEELFRKNGWGGSWRNGIYGMHHFHSTAHEVLGIYRGWDEVQMGGENGITVQVRPGDVVVIPAGVAHKRLESKRPRGFRISRRVSRQSEPALGVVGAYPAGQEWDMCYGNTDERERTLQNIGSVSLPETDPVFGARGPLVDLWSSK
jgi:uncharacterized protein YjlB